MYEVTIETHFSAAHNLRGYRGKCEALHGHNWKVEVTVCSETLDALGMAMDFHNLKRLAAEVMGRLDHRYLNEVPPFDRENPSSELLAKFIFDALAEKIPPGPARLARVRVWESPGSYATYTP